MRQSEKEAEGGNPHRRVEHRDESPDEERNAMTSIQPTSPAEECLERHQYQYDEGKQPKRSMFGDQPGEFSMACTRHVATKFLDHSRAHSENWVLAPDLNVIEHELHSIGCLDLFKPLGKLAAGKPVKAG